MQSLPSAVPQPNAPTYSAHSLDLFKLYMDRPTYEAAFEAQAPAFDPTRPIKQWQDDSQTGSVSYHYYSLDQDGKVTQKTFTAQAESVNLTGALHYAVYDAPETFATQGGSRLNKFQLSMKDQAVAIAAELKPLGYGVEEVVEFQGAPPFPIVYPPDELRRVWLIRGLVVGQLLVTKNRNGVGAPGHWVMGNGEPLWTDDRPTDIGTVGPVHPVTPMPQRNLLPNEEFVTTGVDVLFSGVGFVVRRTDLTQPGSPTAVVGGGLTSDQITKLLNDVAHTRKTVDAILVVVNPPQP